MKNIMLSLVKDFKAMRTWLNDDRFNDNVFQLGDYTTKDGLMGIGFLITCDVSYFKSIFLQALEKFDYDCSRFVFIKQSSDADSCSYGNDANFYKFNIIILVDMVQHLSSNLAKRKVIANESVVVTESEEAIDSEHGIEDEITQEPVSNVEPVVMTNEMFDVLLDAINCDEVPYIGYRGLGLGHDKELRSLSDIESYVDEKLQSTCGISLSRVKYGVSSEGSFGAIVYFEDLPEIEYKPTFRITHGLYVNLFSKINSNYGRGCETVECNGYNGICIYSGDYSLSNEQAVEIINIALMQLATVTLDKVEYGVNNTGGRAVIYFKDLPTR